MQSAVDYKYLNFAQLTEIEGWSTYSLLGKGLIYTQKYPFVKIGDFLKRNKSQVKIQDGVLYKRPTIRMNANGIILRDEVDGKEIGTKNQFNIAKGQFLLSKIDARNGAFGVVPDELDNGIITGNFWTFDVDYTKINPFYLTLLTGTKEFQKLSQSASVGTTNRNYLQEDSFLNFKIPLPPLAEQDAILNSYQSKIKEAQILKQQAQDWEGEIEKCLYSELGIKKTTKRIKSASLNIIDIKEVEKWGVEFNLGSNNDSLLNSQIYKNDKLKNLLEINPKTTLPKEDIEISFIPMECVSDDFGEVIELRSKKVSESKGYKKFQEGDLIWARITPCMQNGKSAIVSNLKNQLGCGSTEFHVIRNNNKNLELKYLYHILRLKSVLNFATSHFTGSAGQQRVPKSFLEELTIPVPPINIQIDISNELSKMKLNIQNNIAKAEILKHQAEQEFEQSIFR